MLISVHPISTKDETGSSLPCFRLRTMVSPGRSGPAQHRLRQFHPDGLQVGVLLHRFEAVVLAAEAGVLVAAERRADAPLAVTIDGDGAGLECARHAHDLAKVLRPDGASPAILGAVG